MVYNIYYPKSKIEDIVKIWCDEGKMERIAFNSNGVNNIGRQVTGDGRWATSVDTCFEL